MNQFTNFSYGEDKRRQILKGFGVEEPQSSSLEKGRKPDAVGTRKTWNGKDYVKTADGSWKASAEIKEAHEKVHGKEIGKTKTGKPIYDEFTHKGHSDFTEEEHLEAANIHRKLSKEHKHFSAAYTNKRDEQKEEEHLKKWEHHGNMAYKHEMKNKK